MFVHVKFCSIQILPISHHFYFTSFMPIINFHSNKHENKFVSSNFIPVFLISPHHLHKMNDCIYYRALSDHRYHAIFQLEWYNNQKQKKGQNKHSIVTLPITAHVNVWTNRWTGLEKCFLEIFKWYFSGSRH